MNKGIYLIIAGAFIGVLGCPLGIIFAAVGSAVIFIYAQPNNASSNDIAEQPSAPSTPESFYQWESKEVIVKDDYGNAIGFRHQQSVWKS